MVLSAVGRGRRAVGVKLKTDAAGVADCKRGKEAPPKHSPPLPRPSLLYKGGVGECDGTRRLVFLTHIHGMGQPVLALVVFPVLLSGVCTQI